MNTVTTSEANLAEAYEGSYYFIAGAGGSLVDWVEGYEKLLREEGIGTPTEWFTTSGAAVNLYAVDRKGFVSSSNRFPNDLTCLVFPLEGLNVGKLAMFKLRMQDRWFDDVIDNMR